MKYFVKEYGTRYFAGIEIPNGLKPGTDDIKKIPKLWDSLFKEYSEKISNKVEPYHFIGLEIYPFDFMETGLFDYCALAETSELINPSEGIVTKKLKPGRYICFPVQFDQIGSEIKKIYDYIKDKKLKVHMGFDYEDYLVGENYGEQGAVLNFCLLLEDNVK